MTIEEKAKAYDEALEKAIIVKDENRHLESALERILLELKESEFSFSDTKVDDTACEDFVEEDKEEKQ